MDISKKDGFTLMEVLVALAVLSIGLLGMAGMQLFSLKSSHGAYMQTQASYIAYDMIDKIRANRTEALGGGYDSALSVLPTGGVVNCQSTSANCTPTQLAAFDLLQWKCSLGFFETNAACAPLNATNVLPGGNASVAVNGNDVTVTVQWAERGAANPETVMIMAEL